MTSARRACAPSAFNLSKSNVCCFEETFTHPSSPCTFTLSTVIFMLVTVLIFAAASVTINTTLPCTASSLILFPLTESFESLLILFPSPTLPSMSIPTSVSSFILPPLILTFSLNLVSTSALSLISSLTTGAKIYSPFPVMCKDLSAMKSNFTVDVELSLTLTLPTIFNSPEGSFATWSPDASVTTTFEISRRTCW